MAITSSYPLATPSMKDNLVGTKFIENKEPVTKSFNIGDIAELIGANIGPGGITSYGQLSRVTDAPIIFNAVNVYQPLGVVGTLSSTVSGFSLGTTDKFALKNISGSTKTVNVSAYLALNYADIAYYSTFVFGLAKNGVIINETIASSFPSIEDQFQTELNTNWIITMENGDEVSIYIKSDDIPTTATFKGGRLVATQV